MAAVNVPVDPSLILLSTPAIRARGRERERGCTISDIYSFLEEDGRTYHGYMAGEYHLPNDGEEQDRQDFAHQIYMLLLDDKLAWAPIQTPRYVLDVATGTGIWALQFAEQNPGSHVVGTDLSLIQPVPLTPNCEFVLEDSEHQDWLYPYLFDYIHFRAVGPCFRSFSSLLSKAYHHMSPGGWVEIQDGCWEVFSYDGTTAGTALERFFATIREGGRRMGRDMTKAKSTKAELVVNGFVDVQEFIIPCPLSPWPEDRRWRRIGNYGMLFVYEALDAFGKTLKAAGLSACDIEELANQVKAELQGLRVHAWCPEYVIYGRRPFPGEI